MNSKLNHVHQSGMISPDCNGNFKLNKDRGHSWTYLYNDNSNGGHCMTAKMVRNCRESAFLLSTMQWLEWWRLAMCTTHIFYVAVITSLNPRLLLSFLYSMQQPGNEASNNLNNSSIYNSSDCITESVMSKLSVGLKMCPKHSHYVQLCSHLYAYHYAQNCASGPWCL